jgi:serine/threonine-protein kinase
VGRDVTNDTGAARGAAAPPAGGLGRLGRYELVHAIASGGMATVYLGRAGGIGGFERLVALKCCHPHLRADEQFASMFLDEARLAARIHHPNVVATLDVGEETALYFVMEYVEGPSLAEWLKALGRPLPAGTALRIACDVLAGLHAAHELRDAAGRPMQLVHRDVSPQNVLVGTDGVARIVDFGIAKATARATVTRGGEIKGKLGYMPPEQFLGQPVTRQADIYAAAVVLWEALAGRRLFQGDSDAAVMNQVLQGRVPSLVELRPELPAGLDQALARALARRADERYETAAAFAEALESAGVALAASRDVGRLVEAEFATWLERRRALVAEVKTRTPGADAGSAGLVVREAPTFLERLLAGKVFILPRRMVVGGVLALMTGAAALGIVLWERARRAPDPRAAALSNGLPALPPAAAPAPPDSPSRPAEVAAPAPAAPAPAAGPAPAPARTRAAAPGKPPRRSAARKPEPPRKPPGRGEFRPKEL